MGRRLTAEERRTGSHLPRGLRDRIRRHEDRHRRVARAFGADGWWEFDSDGGASFYLTNARHLTPIQHAAVALAGNGGSWWAGSGCDKWDEAHARSWINQLPRKERAAAHAEARRLARRYS